MIIDTVIGWLDLVWFPLAYIIVRKWQRLKAMMFVAACLLTLRLQVELMHEIGFQKGFFPFMDTPVLWRGYYVYAVFIAVFLLLSRYSKERDPYVYIAASITVFFAAFCVSTLIMVL